MTWQAVEKNAVWVDWIADYDWNVFGTLNFAPGHKAICIDELRQCSRKFWNKLDRLAYGQTGNRVDRAVFEHFGAFGDNAHTHFLAKLPVDPKFGCVTMNALWRLTIDKAAPPAMNEITPIFDPCAAANYGLREEWKLDVETYNFSLSHRSQPGTLVHKQARQRLMRAADGKWLSNAHRVFPDHIAAAAERYKRRHG